MDVACSQSFEDRPHCTFDQSVLFVCICCTSRPMYSVFCEKVLDSAIDKFRATIRMETSRKTIVGRV